MQRITLDSPTDALIVAVRDMTQGRRVIVGARTHREAGYLHAQALELPDVEAMGLNVRTTRAAGRTALEYLTPLGVAGVVHFVGVHSINTLRGRSADTLLLVELRIGHLDALAETAHAVLATATDPRLMVVPAGGEL